MIKSELLELGVYAGANDTTLALYCPGAGPSLYCALLGEPYKIKHLPWCEDNTIITEEQRYYREHAKRQVTRPYLQFIQKIRDVSYFVREMMENSKAVAGTTDKEFSVIYRQNTPSPVRVASPMRARFVKALGNSPTIPGALCLADRIIWNCNEISYELKIRPNLTDPNRNDIMIVDLIRRRQAGESMEQLFTAKSKNIIAKLRRSVRKRYWRFLDRYGLDKNDYFSV